MYVFRRFTIVETTHGSTKATIQYRDGSIPVLRRNRTFSFAMKNIGVHSVQMPAGLKTYAATPIKKLHSDNLSEIPPTSELLHTLDRVSK